MTITNIKISKSKYEDNIISLSYNNGQKIVKFKASNNDLMTLMNEIKFYINNGA